MVQYRTPRYYVLQNLNDPSDYQIVQDDEFVIAIYAITYGPCSREEAERWIQSQNPA